MVSYIDSLAELAGIATDFYDARGEKQKVKKETKKLILASMGLEAQNEEDAKNTLKNLEEKPWRRISPPVQVVKNTDFPAEIVITLPVGNTDELLSWILEEEEGQVHTGVIRLGDMETEEFADIDGRRFERKRFILPVEPSLGYHRLRFEYPDDVLSEGETNFIVVPPRCYIPSGLDRDIHTWGFPVQLYALNSARNWGMGDFTDLENMVTTAADLGAGIVGINPINTLFPDDPNDACPYGSCSRHYLNYMYIDVEAVPDFEESSKAKSHVKKKDFKQKRADAREAELIDYVAIAELKQPVLEILYESFKENHIEQETSRAEEFKKFCEESGKNLEYLAIFQTLAENIADGSPAPDWRTWRDNYNNSASDEVVRFADENRDRIDFFKYLQWEADRQLNRVSDICWNQNMEVGLYQDLAVGVAGHSAETWSEPELFADGLFIGSPPDDRNPDGQEWGLAPFLPMALYENSYMPFRKIMRANMRSAGALRLDHVMGLSRLYWRTPKGEDKMQGSYVNYPFEDLLGIICLESHRRRCIVVGEDLGSVPDGFRERLQEASILSFRLFYFERNWDTGVFNTPDEYPAEALAAASTHDLPTLNGHWTGHDIGLSEKFGHFVDLKEKKQAIESRARDRALIIDALKDEDIWPIEGTNPDVCFNGSKVPEGYIEAVYRYLARTACPLLLVQLEDIIGQEMQVNLPNTTLEYPNWRRRLSVRLEDFKKDERIQKIAAAMREERPVPAQLENIEEGTGELTFSIPAIPSSTYRVQVNSSFILHDVERLIPYLSALGVSHVYSSPFLRAVSGSQHGYNIVDHNMINPEIGGEDAFEQLSEALRKNDIGLILDFVPNHMGITNGENLWWQDVMEWGKDSPYAKYFDIDWSPQKKELKDKVLVPLLGDYYGKALENGELHLVFDKTEGSFTVWYNEQRFPICPLHYGYILENGLSVAEGASSEDILSLIEEFNSLDEEGDGSNSFRERKREKADELKKRLSEIALEEENSMLIESALQLFNGMSGEPDSFNDLHLLLEKQFYRISFWRVGSNEVNYRRFFSINDLAGLRVDLKEVFEHIHKLVFGLIADGKLQGLRIDHIDGLLHPRQYLSRLEEGVEKSMAEYSKKHGVKKPEKSFYTIVEKILAHDEKLRSRWAVDGTTGYDYMNQLLGLFIDSGGRKSLDRVYDKIAPKFGVFDEVKRRALIHVMDNELAAELNSTAIALDNIAEMNLNSRDFTLYGIRQALKQLVACFSVYRTYITARQTATEDREILDRTVEKAKDINATINPEIFDFIKDVLTADLANQPEKGYSRQAVNEFAMRVQQFTGPVMAKGMEDTAFYRYQRLISLNEVGGEPGKFGTSLSEFHETMVERSKQWPASMLATSTHDTKRGEDARMRISLLSELASEWSDQVTKWIALNSRCKTKVGNSVWPSLNDEYLLYQTIVGVWPLELLDDDMDLDVLEELKGRLKGYMEKAMREAKLLTDWPTPNERYEQAVFNFIDDILDVSGVINPFIDDFIPFMRKIAEISAVNSLSQTLVKLASPGVPDIYRGCESWDFSLVDPDNRRPVDHARLSGHLAVLEENFADASDIDISSLRGVLESWRDGRVKLYLTWKMLQWRKHNSDMFTGGDYIPLEVKGDGAYQVISFARKQGDKVGIFVAPRFISEIYDETEMMMLNASKAVPSAAKIVLPDIFDGREVCFRNILTGKEHKPVDKKGDLVLECRKLLNGFPVAALEVV